MQQAKYVILLFLSLSLLSGCGVKKVSPEKTVRQTKCRYHLKDDAHPLAHEIPDIHKIPNAVPKVEAKSRYGNKKQYQVLNKTYHVLDSSAGFVAKGKASWYGKKFHGHLTSNGEVYNMYSMTAAHKSLPLPTYVKVTNLDNGRHIIVRVNDRGPFHGDRIIDLSYAAAAKLGMLGMGTANVEVRAIEPKTFHTLQPAPKILEPNKKVILAKTTKAPAKPYFLQLGTFSDRTNATVLSRTVGQKLQLTAKIEEHKGPTKTHFKVKLGPFANKEKALAIMAKLAGIKLSSKPIIVN